MGTLPNIWGSPSTNSEAEVIISIEKGKSPFEISEIREVSIHTVRNQLKSAMSKMEARRQSDIVRILSDIG